MTNSKAAEYSFNSWLFSKHELVEKTVGLAVLVIEVLDIVKSLFHPTLPEIPVTEILNLAFLIFIYIQLKKEFKRQFVLPADIKVVSRILRLGHDREKQERINELVVTANKLIWQLRSINSFILATAGLYLLFLVKFIFERKEDNHHIFHLLFDLVSYLGAFYLLRSFFVMYIPTIENGRDVLREKTNLYIWVGISLMVLDTCLTYGPSTTPGAFIGEFICGIVNAVVFVLLIARFENKILDIPPYILSILYVYAVLQTCLPFVTNTGIIESKPFVEPFASIILKLVLVGKIALVAVLLYVLSSKRIFYYFMTVRNTHQEEQEEKHWQKFRNIIVEVPNAWESFDITYNLAPNSQEITAMICPAHLFGPVSGSGRTPQEAKGDLLKKIQITK